VLALVHLRVERKTPVTLREGLQTIGDPVAELVKDHLADRVIGIKVSPGPEREQAGPIGHGEDVRVSTHMQLQLLTARQPDQLQRIAIA
jgi:hypothetical protein